MKTTENIKIEILIDELFLLYKKLPSTVWSINGHSFYSKNKQEELKNEYELIHLRINEIEELFKKLGYSNLKSEILREFNSGKMSFAANIISVQPIIKC